MKTSEYVTKWMIDTIKKNYRDDVALVVSHSTLKINDNDKGIGYFVPVTEKGKQFGQTFILEGTGFDIWGIDWNRLERFADLEEYNITVLADAEILYSRCPEDTARFESLKKRLFENLADNAKIRKCAMNAYAQAKNIFLNMLFSKGSDIRLCAGYTLDYLARTVAFVNHSYFKKSQTDQINELGAMEKLPSDFLNKYLNVITEHSDGDRKKLCYELIASVGDLITQEFGEEENPPEEHYFQDLADWYAELSYTWLRIRHYTELNDVIKTHMWGILLQNELDQVCRDFGLKKMELMSAFDPEDLTAFAKRANDLESEMREIIVNGGGIIHEYMSIEEFENEV